MQTLYSLENEILLSLLSESLGDSLKNSLLPFCHLGVEPTQTGLPLLTNFCRKQ